MERTHANGTDSVVRPVRFCKQCIVSGAQRRRTVRTLQTNAQQPAILIKVPRPLLASLDAYAKREGTTRSEAVRQLIEAGLKHKQGSR